MIIKIATMRGESHLTFMVERIRALEVSLKSRSQRISPAAKAHGQGGPLLLYTSNDVRVNKSKWKDEGADCFSESSCHIFSVFLMFLQNFISPFRSSPWVCLKMWHHSTHFPISVNEPAWFGHHWNVDSQYWAQCILRNPKTKPTVLLNLNHNLILHYKVCMRIINRALNQFAERRRKPETFAILLGTNQKLLKS